MLNIFTIFNETFIHVDVQNLREGDFKVLIGVEAVANPYFS